MLILLALTLLASAALNLIQWYSSHQREQALLDRLMARDLVEYRSLSRSPERKARRFSMTDEQMAQLERQRKQAARA